jgi:hypothetical protein
MIQSGLADVKNRSCADLHRLSIRLSFLNIFAIVTGNCSGMQNKIKTVFNGGLEQLVWICLNRRASMLLLCNDDWLLYRLVTFRPEKAIRPDGTS